MEKRLELSRWIVLEKRYSQCIKEGCREKPRDSGECYITASHRFPIPSIIRQLVFKKSSMTDIIRQQRKCFWNDDVYDTIIIVNNTSK